MRYFDFKQILTNFKFINILSKSKQDIFNFFIKKKFNFILYNELDSVDNCFDYLLLENDHPARNKRDTFYVNDSYIMRTHTTCFQSLVIDKFYNLNFSVESIGFFTFGKVFRKDSDTTHSPVFNQFDFIFFSKKNSVKILYLILNDFLFNFFNKKIETKLRINYFPFTSPSFELDIKCLLCKNICSVCKNGWIEIAGCGMTNRTILKKHKNYVNKKDYLVCAAGVGIERLIMLKYKIDSIKSLNKRYFFLNYEVIK
jgi:phenylalanyl-tRNA synthetase alpha chain